VGLTAGGFGERVRGCVSDPASTVQLSAAAASSSPGPRSVPIARAGPQHGVPSHLKLQFSIFEISLVLSSKGAFSKGLRDKPTAATAGG